jgi:hypothetical protein
MTKWVLPLWWLAMALWLMVPAAVRAQEQGYTVANPANNDSMGVVLADGTWQVWLGAGCEGVDRDGGQNVLVSADGDAMTFQVIDPLLGVQEPTCQVVRRLKRDDAPCATNPDGVCDVAWAR